MSYARLFAVAGAVMLTCALTLQGQDTPPVASDDQPQEKSAPPPETKSKGKSKSARASDQPGQSGYRTGNEALESSNQTENGSKAEDEKASGSQQTDRRAPIAPDDRVIQFSFVTQPWDKLLDWVAELSGLSLQYRVKPQGTFNYINDPNKYTLGEAMDIMNAQLIPDGIALLRKANYLFVVSLKDGPPKDLIPRIKLEEIDERGESEFVTVWIELANASAKVVSEDLKTFKGEYGEIVPHEGLNRLLITDTVANIRLMRDYLKQITEKNGSGLQARMRRYELKYVPASKVEAMLRDLFALPPKAAAGTTTDRSRSSADPRDFFRDQMRNFFGGGGGGPGGFPGMTFGGPGGDSRGGDSRGGDSRGGDSRSRDGSSQQQQQTPQITLAVDELNNQLFVTAPPDKLAIVEQVIEMVDVRREGQEPYTPGMSQSPVPRVYRLSDADAQSFVAALQATFKDVVGIRFSADQSNNSVLVVATPDDHKATAKLIEEFERDEREAVVIPLTVLDSASVETLLGAVYASGQRDWRGNLVVRPGQPRIVADRNRNQLTVRASKKQLDDIHDMLVQLGEPRATQVAGNDKLRIIQLTPGSAQAVRDAMEQFWPKVSPNNNPIRIVDLGRRSENEPSVPPDADAPLPNNRRAPRTNSNADEPDRTRTVDPARRPDRTSRSRLSSTRFVSYGGQDESRKDSDDSAQEKTDQAPQKPAEPQAGAPLVVSIGQDSIVFASDDPEAVRAFDEFMKNFTRATARSSGPEYTVFYLKSADATQLQQTLNDLMGLGVSSFFGSSSQATSTVKIVPDVRTNSLIVFGNANDVNRVDQLLRVLDRDDAPPSGAMSAPRIIPVRYANATSVSRVIRDVYASRMVSGPGGIPGGPGGFPGGGSPFGSSSFGSSRSSRNTGTGTLAVGVDEQSNSIVVSCSESTFQEVKQLVETLDSAANATQRTVQIVTVRNSTPTAVQDALNGLMGVSTRSSSSSSRSPSDSFRSSGGFPSFGGPQFGGPQFGGSPFGGSFSGGFPGGSVFFNRDGGGDRGRSFDSGRGGFPGGGGGFPFGGSSGFGGSRGDFRGGDRRP